MGEEEIESGQAKIFEQLLLPHMDAAYDLARWLDRNTHDARAWVLKIVPNSRYSFLERNRPAHLAEEFGERIDTASTEQSDAEAVRLQSADSRMVREVLVLRELEDTSYKEIAEVMDVPLGTVISALARGRGQSGERLLRMCAEEVEHGLRW